MYKDGWCLAMRIERIPWRIDPEALAKYAPGGWDPDEDTAELYHIDRGLLPGPRSRGQASREGGRAQGAVLGGGGALPGHAAAGALSTFFGMLPAVAAGTRFDFLGDVQNILSGMIPHIYNRSYSISADLDIPETGPRA